MILMPMDKYGSIQAHEVVLDKHPTNFIEKAAKVRRDRSRVRYRQKTIEDDRRWKMTEDGRQKTTEDNRRRKTPIKKPKMEAGRWATEDGRWKT